MSDKPAGPLLVDQLRYMADRFPDEPGYVDLDAKTALSFGEWEAQSNQAARWLVENGVRKGDRVAIALPNNYCLRWIVAYAAVHKAGAAMVPANTRLSTPEMIAILGHAEISMMFTCNEMLEHARAVREAVPTLRSIVCADGPDTDVLGWDAEIASVDGARDAGARRRGRHGRHHVHVGYDRTAEGRARPSPQRCDDPEQRAALDRAVAGCTARRCSRSRA